MSEIKAVKVLEKIVKELPDSKANCKATLNDFK